MAKGIDLKHSNARSIRVFEDGSSEPSIALSVNVADPGLTEVELSTSLEELEPPYTIKLFDGTGSEIGTFRRASAGRKERARDDLMMSANRALLDTIKQMGEQIKINNASTSDLLRTFEATMKGQAETTKVIVDSIHLAALTSSEISQKAADGEGNTELVKYCIEQFAPHAPMLIAAAAQVLSALPQMLAATSVKKEEPKTESKAITRNKAKEEGPNAKV